MIAWQHLSSAEVPGKGGELRLYQRGEEFSIRIGGAELMNSRIHASEDALAAVGCEHLRGQAGARVLIGGLGMGYTLAAALGCLPADAQVVVAELLPAVVSWNRELFGHLAGHPLRDGRVEVKQGDVANLLRSAGPGYDAILLDVDNGPAGLTRAGNDWLYGRAGLAAAHTALRPKGVLCVWSASPDHSFAERMRRADFGVQERSVRAAAGGKGSRYTLFIGMRSAA